MGTVQNLYALMSPNSDPYAHNALYREYRAHLIRVCAAALSGDSAHEVQEAYQMVGKVRDCHAPSGSGLRTSAYEMVAAWATLPSEFQPMGQRLACDAVEAFVQGLPPSRAAYGSWRDVRGVCEAVRVRSRNNTQHPVIVFCVRLVCDQLARDLASYHKGDGPVSLTTCAKWVPREKSATHGWFARLIAKRFYLTQCYDVTSHPDEAALAFRRFWTRARVNKARSHLRKTVSLLCGPYGLDTLESNMCNERWGQVLPQYIPMDARSRYARALLNVEPDGAGRDHHQTERKERQNDGGKDDKGDNDEETLLGEGVDPKRESLANDMVALIRERSGFFSGPRALHEPPGGVSHVLAWKVVQQARALEGGYWNERTRALARDIERRWRGVVNSVTGLKSMVGPVHLQVDEETWCNPEVHHRHVIERMVATALVLQDKDVYDGRLFIGDCEAYPCSRMLHDRVAEAYRLLVDSLAIPHRKGGTGVFVTPQGVSGVVFQEADKERYQSLASTALNAVIWQKCGA
jgi:hypothetical protein